MSTIFSAAVTLFLMMDPIGNVPAFAALLKDVDARRRSKAVLREHLFALGVLLFFLVCGPQATRLLHIDNETLAITGGIVLFIVALEMIFPGRRNGYHDAAGDAEPFIVPMAIPLIAGPSTMAALMFMSSSQPERRLEWFVALMLAWTASLTVLLSANRLRPLFSPRALTALERLMGMVLLVLATQMSLTGVKGFVAALHAVR